MSTLVRTAAGGCLYTKGASEIIVDICTSYVDNVGPPQTLQRRREAFCRLRQSCRKAARLLMTWCGAQDMVVRPLDEAKRQEMLAQITAMASQVCDVTTLCCDVTALRCDVASRRVA